jgi:hypothetical protein
MFTTCHEHSSGTLQSRTYTRMETINGMEWHRLLMKQGIAGLTARVYETLSQDLRHMDVATSGGFPPAVMITVSATWSAYVCRRHHMHAPEVVEETDASPQGKRPVPNMQKTGGSRQAATMP